MPKDRLVRTSGRHTLDKNSKIGTVRIKPAKKVGKNDKGELVQNIVRKYPDGSKSTERFAGGKRVGETITPKTLRKKKVRKIRSKRPKLAKAGKAPNYELKLSKMGPAERKAWEKQERNKKLAARYNKRNKNVFTRLISKVKGGVSPLNMNGPTFDAAKGWKKVKPYTNKNGVKGSYVTDPNGKKYFMTSNGKLHTGQIEDLMPETKKPAPTKDKGEKGKGVGTGYMNPPYKDKAGAQKAGTPYAKRQGYHGFKNFESNVKPNPPAASGNSTTTKKSMKDGPKTATHGVKGGTGNWQPYSQRKKK